MPAILVRSALRHFSTIESDLGFPPARSGYIGAMMFSSRMKLAVGAWLLVTAFGAFELEAQTRTQSAVRNLIGNGSFESSFRRDNLWDGVDAAGYLSGDRGALPVLTTSGTIADSSMPLSVSVADMNNDGLLDIVTMDVIGYLRVYFNSGSPKEPKFEMGDLVGVFLTRVAPNDPVMEGTNRTTVRRGQRIHTTRMFGTGKYDLLIGNYAGELLALMNSGSIQAPDFRQPRDVASLEIPTSKNRAQKWGNLFAPVTWDWNGDRKEDVLLGEGSFSANNIHLLLNTGSGNRPSFDEDNRYVLAFGDGLEQLTPTVVDANGDGLPDLLIGERTGKIALYLNKGEEWRRGDPPPELAFASFLNTTKGSPLTFRGICTVSTGDLNGDGLFDLVVGKSNGRVSVAFNKGSKEEPKFDTPTDLKGTSGTQPMAMPSGWDVDYGVDRGNFLAYVSVIKESDDKNLNPADGKAALKFGYQPSHNKIIPAPSNYLPALGRFTLGEPPLGGTSASILSNAPARYFMLRQAGRFRLKVGTSYTFSMKVRGRASEGRVGIVYSGQKTIGEARVTQEDRGAVRVQRNEAREVNHESMTFNPGSSWSEVKRTFRVDFKNRDLSDLKQTSGAALQISFTLPNGGELYIDDVKLTERQ
jgi:hypothetical protein